MSINGSRKIRIFIIEWIIFDFLARRFNTIHKIIINCEKKKNLFKSYRISAQKSPYDLFIIKIYRIDTFLLRKTIIINIKKKKKHI